MAELLQKLAELKRLPDDVHLFCPRIGDDGLLYYEEDIAGHSEDDDEATRRDRRRKLQQANERKWLTLEALQILAFDGPDAAPHKLWLIERLNTQMTSCDVCVRIFHKSRIELKHKLEEQYEEDEVASFLRVLDGVNIERITRGLDTATTVLKNTEPRERGTGVLPQEAIYAFFECVSCSAMVNNNELLKRHFDIPFALVQSKRKLRLSTYVPAMTKFLFGSDENRLNWALHSWKKIPRNLLSSEFDWVVREDLTSAMQRVQITSLEMDFVPTFWQGVWLIVNKLDKDLITHSLRAIDLDIYKICLEHLQLNSNCFVHLVCTMQLLLEKSPTDFWDAMGAISPVTVVEQIFSSPALRRILLEVKGDVIEEPSALDDVFSWVMPLLVSIKASNIAPACRALANQFLGRLQAENFSPASRAYCYKTGLQVLDYALLKVNSGNTKASFVGQATVSDVLEILSSHINIIIAGCKRSKEANLGLGIIQNAFRLECLSLEMERESIIRGEGTQSRPSKPASLWAIAIKAIDIENLDLATHILTGARPLICMESFFIKPGVAMVSPSLKHFNSTFDSLSQSVTETVERLNDFEPDQLDSLFENPMFASAVIATLFSSQAETRQATIELLKVVSSEDTRKEAIKHILVSFYHTTLQSFSDSIRRVIRKKIFAPASSIIKTCADLVDILCNSQDGLLRSRTLSPKEAKVTTVFWQNLWDALTIIFKTTEDWSNMGHDKTEMMDFCRDTMQFAGQLFDQCSIFATALKESIAGHEDSNEKSGTLKELLSYPAKTVEGMAKWLRLRDEFLSTRSVTLISKILVRLQKVSIEVDENTIDWMEGVITGEVRAKLSIQQQAELERALEIHVGHPLAKPEESVKAQKQGLLNDWVTSGPSKSRTTSGSELDTSYSKLLADSTRGAEAFKARNISQKSKQATVGLASQKAAERKAAEVAEFKKKREAEKEAKKKRDAVALALAKKNSALRGWSDHTAEAGSGLEGLGVLGKDHAAKGEGMMVSSDESDDGDPIDAELFGLTKTTKKGLGTNVKTNIVIGSMQQAPVKKRKVVRSVKDMRARLAPDLSPLHKIILSWDYYHDGDFPPKSRTDIYTAVPNTFRTPHDYQRTFEPLLTLEAWQGFVKAREENNFKTYEIKIVARSSVDAFQEVSSTMTHVDNRELNISEGDVVLLSKSKASSSSDPSCLARVFRITRKKGHLEVAYRVMPGNPLQSSLVPNATVYGAKIQSLTPLEREYGALLGLQYYDLCDEIIKAKPSPLLNYSEKVLEPLMSNYNVNRAQAKAIKSAIDNDAFTLIQGPPGSGKTKTIIAIVGAVLTDSLRQQGTVIEIPKAQGSRSFESAPKKLLVCAPSNAAVDELVMRFKDGVKTLGGQHRKLNIVRLGRSDAINANVTDVTLEELVNKKLNLNPANGTNEKEKTQKLFQDHQAVSEKLREAREKLDGGQAKGEEAVKLKEEFDVLRRRKTQLGTQIDSARDNENLMSRQAELNRRRAQQQILDEAHVICATLSGSGHDMFQSLNIEFETVIVDEAAQCVEMSALIPLKYGCAKCILVGDPKQLPPTVFSKEAARFQYEQSLFVRMQNNHSNDVHLLDTQYRMHPEISVFPSKTFYDGKLLDGSDMAILRRRPWHASSLLGPYRFFDVQGQHQAAPKGHSLINIAEIEVALQLFNRLTTDFDSYDFKGKIGIITPYKSQLRELKDRFSRKYGQVILESVEFNTTDAFQGRESEIIIFSCVRASPAGGIGFLQDIRRMNVGLTRAKSSLWVLGNSQSLVRGEFWKKLVHDAQNRDRYSTGNITAMLQRPSSPFPSNAGGNLSTPMLLEAPTGPSQNFSNGQRVKQETRIQPMGFPGNVKTENISRRLSSSVPAFVPVKAEPINDINENGKRKANFNSDEDVEMNDVPSDSEDGNDTSGKASGRSTPIATPCDARNSLVKAKVEEGLGKDTERPLAGGAPAPVPRTKILAPKRRKEVDPFIKPNRPKKPKPN
ncbi:tRNA-splicing endonuclease-like protein [Lepidopterella palustris CBS 459.81]|uniref:tRNA-splicing endonuclease-like protein n=1 Tax=Lepidopterella palustris CBS 459.81 TaxID=1314670 RepID=A0A8E2JDL9_9PEZI|nr:tRNA-splicing endonuclease-like protein [Lepidopterella palustris CBS 459.81]